MTHDDHAVVVGIARYPALGDLGGPEHDAEDFFSWLISPAGGGVPAANARKILSSDFPPPGNPLDAEPTMAVVERAFAELYDLGDQKGGRAGRRLYIYLAGHGFAPNLEDAALLMANAARGRTGYHIPGRPYANWFRQAAFFEEVVLLMDCCRENYTSAPLQVVPYETINGHPEANHFYGFATDWSRGAREGPWGMGGEVRGLFTLALLAGLRGGAADANGLITGQSLESFAFNYLQLHSTGEERQEPRFEYNRTSDLIFATTSVPVFHVRITLSGENIGKPVEMLNGALDRVQPSSSSADIWQWNIPRGLYSVHVPGAQNRPLELIGQGGDVNVAF